MRLPLTIKPWRCLNLPARFTGSRLNRAFQIADSLLGAQKPFQERLFIILFSHAPGLRRQRSDPNTGTHASVP